MQNAHLSPQGAPQKLTTRTKVIAAAVLYFLAAWSFRIYAMLGQILGYDMGVDGEYYVLYIVCPTVIASMLVAYWVHKKSTSDGIKNLVLVALVASIPLTVDIILLGFVLTIYGVMGAFLPLVGIFIGSVIGVRIATFTKPTSTKTVEMPFFQKILLDTLTATAVASVLSMIFFAMRLYILSLFINPASSLFDESYLYYFVVSVPITLADYFLVVGAFHFGLGLLKTHASIGRKILGVFILLFPIMIHLAVTFGIITGFLAAAVR
jgi:hypothetical protein